MKNVRGAGILHHPTSLPGPFGIGDLGPQAFRWMDFLAEAGATIWKVLPLGPTGYGDAPYQCHSAFAGNTSLLSPERLVSEGLIAEDDLRDHPAFPFGSAEGTQEKSKQRESALILTSRRTREQSRILRWKHYPVGMR
jgi:4-alpha-glucanotransferase